MRQKGFTLIELLVVIAIIAILAAILFPVFIAVKGKSQQAGCMANVKQIAMASQLYMDNNNGAIVPASLVFILGSQYDTYNPGHHWWGALYTYTKNKGVFCCPGDKYKNMKPAADWITEDMWKSKLLPRISYRINLNINPDPRISWAKAQRYSFLPWIAWDGMKWARESAIMRPSKLILFSERHSPDILWGLGGGPWIWWGDIMDPGRAWGPPASTGKPPRTAPDYHNDGGNFVFVDGHVKFLKETTKEMWYGSP